MQKLKKVCTTSPAPTAVQDHERTNAQQQVKGLLLQAGTVVATAANLADVTQAQQLLHGSVTEAWADAGYHGVDKRFFDFI